MTAMPIEADEPLSPFTLSILGETPAYLARRIAAHRKADPDAPVDTLARRVVAELNAGQRQTLAIIAVTANVAAYDRAHVRAIEKAAVKRRAPRGSRQPRDIDPAVIEQARAEISAVRALAEKAALEMVVELSPELLDAPIKLGDGREVLTGDATADQLQARVDMLDNHAQGAAGTLARALAVLNLLRSSGRETLREVAGK